MALSRATLALTVPGRRPSYGSGAFVAPGWVVTCAHVVADEKGAPWPGPVPGCREDGEELFLDVVPEWYLPWAGGQGPDLALLRVIDPRPGQDRVRLCAPVDVGDELWSYGYPADGYRQGDSLSLRYLGPSVASGVKLLKAGEGQATAGFSGAPVLNWRTGGVCGLIRTSRDRRSDLGARLVPASAIMDCYADVLASASKEAGAETDRWRALLTEDQIAAGHWDGQRLRPGSMWAGASYLPPGPKALRGDEIPRPELTERLLGELLGRPRPARGRRSARGRTGGRAKPGSRRAATGTPAVVTLTGPGGFGKSTLAALACQDSRLRERFPGGVLWVTLGERAGEAEIHNEVSGLLTQFSSAPQPATLQGSLRQLREFLDDGRRLLVIDDVWREEQLAPFLTLTSRCTRLVITRVRSLSLATGRAAVVEMESMTAEQSAELLTRDLPEAPETVWAGLLRCADGMPLLLALINRYLSRRLGYGDTLLAAVRNAEDDLMSRGSTALDLPDAGYRDQAVAATVGAGLRLLSARQPEVADLYAALAVFPEDTAIPLTTLFRYWRTTASLTDQQAEQICLDLADLALVHELRLGGARPALRLHSTVRSYLAHLAPERLAQMHRGLLDAHRRGVPADERGLTRWWLMPESEPYLWGTLVHHLREAAGPAGQPADPHPDDLLCELRWVEARLRLAGPTAAIADFAHTTSQTALRLRETLSASAHILLPLGPPGLLSATLAVRLHGTPCLDESLARYRRVHGGAALTPAWPLPDRPPPAFNGALALGLSGIRTFALSPDGTRMATGREDGTVSTWRLTDGQQLARHQRSSSPVSALCVAGNGLVAVSDADGRFWVWDPSDPSSPSTEHTGFIPILCTVAADPARPRFAVTGGSRHSPPDLYFFDHRSRELRTPVSKLRFLADHDRFLPLGILFATPYTGLSPWVGLASAVGVWSVELAMPWVRVRRQRALADHLGLFKAVAFSDDGGHLATCDGDNRVQLWDARGRLRASFQGPDDSFARVALDPTGTWLARVGTTSLVVWHLPTGAQVLARELEPNFFPALAFSDDGKWLATVHGHDTVKVWSLPGLVERASVTGLHSVSAVGFTPGAAALLTAMPFDTGVRSWDLPTLLGSGSRETAVPLWSRSVAFGPGDVWLASGDSDGRVRLRSPGGDVTGVLGHHDGPVQSVVVAGRDQDLIVSAGHDQQVQIHERAGRKLAALDHPDTLYGLAAAEGCDWFVSFCGDGVRVWGTDGTLRHSLPRDAPSSDNDPGSWPFAPVVVPPCGTWYAYCQGHVVRLRDAATHRETAVLRGHADTRGNQDENNHICALAVSVDGRLLASAAADGRILVHDVRARTVAATLMCDDPGVLGLTFSPDGTLLAGIDFDNTLLVWRLDRAECVTGMRADAGLSAVAWSADGDHLAIGSHLGVYLLRFLPPPGRRMTVSGFND
ncbi:NB-ARC domain-containing protein [Streptomyces fuscichromogenes]|uniref:NB-ARC domain-containing protein n=1 Tax=Streptomyces fuscichromogenes TaxID=1324013 RepID=UPI0037FB0D20